MRTKIGAASLLAGIAITVAACGGKGDSSAAPQKGRLPPRRRRNLHPPRRTRLLPGRRLPRQPMSRLMRYRPRSSKRSCRRRVRDARPQAVHRRPRRDDQATTDPRRRHIQPDLLLRRPGRAARRRLRDGELFEDELNKIRPARHQGPRGLHAAAARPLLRRWPTARSIGGRADDDYGRNSQTRVDFTNPTRTNVSEMLVTGPGRRRCLGRRSVRPGGLRPRQAATTRAWWR